MSQTKRKTDAEGLLEDIRLRFTDVPPCCSSGGMACSWQIEPLGDYDVWGSNAGRIVCCGCGEPLDLERDDDAEDDADIGGEDLENAPDLTIDRRI